MSAKTTSVAAAATAAATAADAAIALATSTATTARALADAKTASDIALAVMGNDISHIKSDLVEIKGLFVATSSQYATKEVMAETVVESEKVHDDHEVRIRSIEGQITRIMTWGSVALVLLTVIQIVLKIYGH